MTAPERVWAGPDRGSNWSYGWWTLIGPDDLNRTRTFILATPEALAASPEVQALIAEAETRGWNAAIGSANWRGLDFYDQVPKGSLASVKLLEYREAIRALKKGP